MGIYLGGEVGMGFAPVIAAAAAGPAAPLALIGTGPMSFFKSIIGAFSKRGRVKTETAAIADQGFPVLRDIAARFRQGELTKAQALQLLDGLWGEMVRLWREYDRANKTTQGARSITSQRVYFLQVRNSVVRAPDPPPSARGPVMPRGAPPARGAPPVALAPSEDIADMLPWVAAAGAAYFLL